MQLCLQKQELWILKVVVYLYNVVRIQNLWTLTVGYICQLYAAAVKQVCRVLFHITFTCKHCRIILQLYFTENNFIALLKLFYHPCVQLLCMLITLKLQRQLLSKRKQFSENHINKTTSAICVLDEHFNCLINDRHFINVTKVIIVRMSMLKVNVNILR